MTMISVDILTRSDDGAFHSVSCIPCLSKPKITDAVNSLLRDDGASVAQSIKTESSFMILLLRRLCRKVGEKMHVNTSLHLSGSALLGAAIPGMSDIDMVLKVEGCADSQVSATKEKLLMETFFQQMIQELKVRGQRPSAAIFFYSSIRVNRTTHTCCSCLLFSSCLLLSE